MSGLPEIYVDVLGPVVIIVVIGYIAGRHLDLPPEPLARLAYWVIGPAFIFDALASAELPGGELLRIAGASGAAAAVSAIAAYVLAARLPTDRRGCVVATGTWGNVGNFGLAVAAFTFDDGVLPYAAVCLVVVNTFGLIVAIGTARGGWAGLWSALKQPMTLVVVPALVVNATGVTLPKVVDRPVALLAAAVIPVMLLTIGLQFERMGRLHVDADTARSLVVKLAVQPVAAILAVAAFQLSDRAGGTVVLQAAMPAAVFTAVLAIEHDSRADETATIILLGTVVSMLTLPVFILYVT